MYTDTPTGEVYRRLMMARRAKFPEVPAQDVQSWKSILRTSETTASNAAPFDCLQKLSDKRLGSLSLGVVFGTGTGDSSTYTYFELERSAQLRGLNPNTHNFNVVRGSQGHTEVLLLAGLIMAVCLLTILWL